MSSNLHRYGIMVHRKGTSYEDDSGLQITNIFRSGNFPMMLQKLFCRSCSISGVMVTRSGSGG